LRLLAEPDFAVTLARNAREASKRFTGAAIKQQWLELYQQLANSDSPATESSTQRDWKEHEEILHTVE
jgi:hypothetical protein